MDGKERESFLWLGIWSILVAILGYFFFRNRKDLTINRIWLFAGFAVFGAFVAMVVAPVFAGARAARTQGDARMLRKPLIGMIEAESREEFEMWLVANLPPGDRYARWKSILHERRVEGRGILIASEVLSVDDEGRERVRTSADFRLRGPSGLIGVRVTGIDRQISDLRVVPVPPDSLSVDQ